jgi:O-antigen/teichoic acid export membrane protein
VAFVVPLTQLGLNSILVQETIEYPQEEGAIFGTSIVMSLCSAVACIVGVVSFAYVANSNSAEVVAVCALYSVVLLFQAADLIQYWFQAKYLSKYTSVVSLCAYAAVSAYKIYLLIYGKSVYWFAVTQALDIMLIAAALLTIYRKLGGQKLRFRPDIAKRMFAKSRYYIVSSMMVTVFAQTDKIMLTLMIDEAATGYYSAAVTCAGMTGFVFSAIIDSMRPSILEKVEISTEAYELETKRLYCVIIYLALLQSAFLTLLAKPVVQLLYGMDFLPAVSILQVIVWYTTFSYLGGAKDVWILAEGKQKYLIILNLSGALMNVALNWHLIPIWGEKGAAVASLVTQIITNVVMMFVLKPLRRNGWLIYQSINPKILGSMIKMFLRKEI